MNVTGLLRKDSTKMKTYWMTLFNTFNTFEYQSYMCIQMCYSVRNKLLNMCYNELIWTFIYGI